jgi:ribosomal protein S18 acetylase RimI-like enzyme
MIDTLADDLTLRASGAGDEPFLAAVYASTRADELAPLPWSDDQRRAFLAMQHRAQHTDYHGRYPHASFDVVLLGPDAIGRLYIDRGVAEHRVIDIALLPDFRGRGIGGRLLDTVLAGAGAALVPVRLHVEGGNRAITLYRRMGFVAVPTTEEGWPSELYHELEWWPPVNRAGQP